MGNKYSQPAISFTKNIQKNLAPAISTVYNDYTDKSTLILPNNPYYQTSFNSPAIYLTKPSSLPTQPIVEPTEQHNEKHTEEHDEPLPDVKEYTLNNTSIFIILPVLLVASIAIYYFATKFTHQTTLEN
jgi:hypothetical protein